MKKIRLGSLNKGKSGGHGYITVRPQEGQLIFRSGNGEEMEVKYLYLGDKSPKQPDFVQYNVFTKKE